MQSSRVLERVRIIQRPKHDQHRIELMSMRYTAARLYVKRNDGTARSDSLFEPGEECSNDSAEKTCDANEKLKLETCTTQK